MGKVVDLKTKKVIKDENPVVLQMDPLSTLTDAFYMTFASLSEFLYINEINQNNGKPKRTIQDFQKQLIHDIANQFDNDDDGNDDDDRVV